jgi:tRNA (cmo5U34)-methyltransferase
VYQSLREGGGFLMAEKTLATDSKFQDLMQFRYYDRKREAFTDTSILSKEKALRRIMKCSTLEEQISNLHKVGFRQVQVFWRRYNFVGILAIK